MPFRTQYGKHYHMTEGCHGATIPCDTKGLTPCSDCCGGAGETGGGSTSAGSGTIGGGSPQGGTIAIDSEIIGVADVKVGGVKGTLYKLDRLLDPEERKAISELEGARTVIIAAQYAPELKRTGVFVEDGYSYSIGRAEEIANIGFDAMADPMAAPDIDLGASAPRPSQDDLTAVDDDTPLHAVDPSDSRALTVAAWQVAKAEAGERDKVTAYVAREKTLGSIESDILTAMARDYDVSDERGYIANQVRILLDSCDVRPNTSGKPDTYTMQLVSQYVVFAAGTEGYIGGSAADYCASHAMDALRGYEIRLRDDADADMVLARIRRGIDETALYKDREYGELGGAGVPIFRTAHLDEEMASQGAEGRRLSRMSKAERQALWQEEASEWGNRWAATHEIRGEGRDASEVLQSYPDFTRAKRVTDDVWRAVAFQTDSKLARRYGDAYTPAMQEERRKAYSSAASKALRSMSSRRQVAEQHARLHADALRTVEATRDYDEGTRLRDLHPEDRRQLALELAREANGRNGAAMSDRAKAEAIATILDAGTVADIRQVVDTDPVALVDVACADALIGMRSRGQRSPRE